MEVKKVDSEGRLYLGKEFAGKEVYVIRLFDGILIVDEKRKAEEIERRKTEFLRDGIEKLLDFLGEPSAEEIDETLELLRKRKRSPV
jgi:hypothetical protein